MGSDRGNREFRLKAPLASLKSEGSAICKALLTASPLVNNHAVKSTANSPSRRLRAQASEQQPQTKLDLTRLIDSRTMRLSNVRDHIAASIEDLKRLRLKIRVIQEIEHLRPELHFQLLTPQILVLE